MTAAFIDTVNIVVCGAYYYYYYYYGSTALCWDLTAFSVA
jgi:hypothetical protein